ncbi:hypothetical protein Gbem_3681 [Citrifermentans bemidjiense Bem]|uniref:Uncharacterized protein n=1 Tax=Citrifermentans bemidjiense (strain ATCC BAA-1014 / DSM 16622 / JCM 12645 / Bem) TaxID=404380 RepID=B5EDP5_CITBB|nr:hypothetical protein Gbem_3681 [Citrifermentans bemidjiense Bem]
MSVQRYMIGYRVELLNGSVRSGTVGVPGDDPAAACRATVAMIRGHVGERYGRPACFADIPPHEVDDISVQILGSA